jgi:SHS2 domain-containing protein
LGGGFEILDHTADVAIWIWGDEKRDLFEAAVNGMLSLVADIDKVHEKKKIEFKVERDCEEELLLQLLREVVYRMELGGMVFSSFSIKEDNFSYKHRLSYSITGVLRGERIDYLRHDICSDIKAVTRHGLEIMRKGSIWETKILFDV